MVDCNTSCWQTNPLEVPTLDSSGSCQNLDEVVATKWAPTMVET